MCKNILPFTSDNGPIVKDMKHYDEFTIILSSCERDISISLIVCIEIIRHFYFETNGEKRQILVAAITRLIDSRTPRNNSRFDCEGQV